MKFGLESPSERGAFDRDTTSLFEGDVMLHMASVLRSASGIAHPDGSYAKVMVIMSNECLKASRKNRRRK